MDEINLDQVATVEADTLSDAEHAAYSHLCAAFGDMLPILDVRSV